MGKHPRVRCPACGMLVYLHQLKQDYDLDFYVVTIGGKDSKGKPVLDYSKQPFTIDLVQAWISRLEAVLEQLHLQVKSEQIRIVIPASIGRLAYARGRGVDRIVYKKQIDRVVIAGE